MFDYIERRPVVRIRNGELDMHKKQRSSLFTQQGIQPIIYIGGEHVHSFLSNSRNKKKK